MDTNKTPIIINLPYCGDSFARAIARMSKEQIYRISIEVWGYDAQGTPIEILRSRLAPDVFDEICKNPSRMIFKGSKEDLRSIGVC